MEPLSVIITTDGSNTIRNERTGDTYHSIHGAIQESTHVFIQNGLRYFRQLYRPEFIRLLEVGFGTGLNALLTLAESKDVAIEYTCLEPYPLSAAIYQSLNFDRKEALLSLHETEWGKSVPISGNFILIKQQTTLQQAQLSSDYFNVVYFDAFAPSSQPELWSLEIFEKIRTHMAKPSLFVTYCAKGQVKRDLKSIGFKVESIPGPPGKREMIRASLK